MVIIQPAPERYRSRRHTITSRRHRITRRLAITKALEPCRPCLSSSGVFFLTRPAHSVHKNTKRTPPPTLDGRNTMNPATVSQLLPSAGKHPSPLLERVRKAAREHGLSEAAAAAIVARARAFILFHNKRHPSGLGLADVTLFLAHVVQTAKQPLLALADARSAVTPLRGSVLRCDLG